MVVASTETRDRDQCFRRRKCSGYTRKLIGMLFEIIKELLKFTLHLRHLFAHIENDLDSGKVHTEFARQRENDLETLKVRVLEKACVPDRTRWHEQSFALV